MEPHTVCRTQESTIWVFLLEKPWPIISIFLFLFIEQVKKELTESQEQWFVCILAAPFILILH